MAISKAKIKALEGEYKVFKWDLYLFNNYSIHKIMNVIKNLKFQKMYLIRSVKIKMTC